MSDWTFDPGRYAGCSEGPFLLFDRSGTLQVSDSAEHGNRDAIVHWTGFDSSDKPKKTKRANARLLADSWNLLKEVERLTAEVEQLRSFAMRVMKAWPHGDVDGMELQEAAIECGLLRPEQRTTPCAESCFCAEYVAPDEFRNGVTCFRRTALLTKVEEPNHG